MAPPGKSLGRCFLGPTVCLTADPQPHHLPIHCSLVKAGHPELHPREGASEGALWSRGLPCLEDMLSAAPPACPLLATSTSRPLGPPCCPGRLVALLRGPGGHGSREGPRHVSCESAPHARSSESWEGGCVHSGEKPVGPGPGFHPSVGNASSSAPQGQSLGEEI